jgi:diguanylate cyclase (GGDEF)-like protein
MPASWAEALRELRGEYLREARERARTIRELIDAIEARPSEAASLRELNRLFHGLAGSGTTYGFPELTALGIEGERACGAARAPGLSPAASEIAAWRGLLARIESVVTQAETTRPAEGGEAPAAAAAPRPATVFVADEDPARRERLARRLEAEGLLARRFDALTAAERALDQSTPEGVVLSARLGDGSVYALVRRLRERPGGEDLGIVVLSDREALLDRVEAIHSGADVVAVGDVGEDTLWRRLRPLLERVQAEPGRVLAFEDEPSQGSFIETVLGAAGFAVRVCRDPGRLDAELSTSPPDLVLMDVLLPGVSGFDLVRYLRQSERYATLPVLFLTTEGQLHARIEGLRAGGDDYLVKPVAPALLISAVAARVERGRTLRRLLERDGLTGLLTHSAFIERAKQAIARHSRAPERPLAWAMLDLDRFKEVNDRHGHPTGDRVLAALASLLRRRLRQSDLMGRYGGEEFTILLEDLGEADAVRLVERLLEEFRTTDHVGPDGTRFRVTFSAGVAVLGGAGATLESWLSAADDALYAAKAQGRCKVLAASRLPR